MGFSGFDTLLQVADLGARGACHLHLSPVWSRWKDHALNMGGLCL